MSELIEEPPTAEPSPASLFHPRNTDASALRLEHEPTVVGALGMAGSGAAF
jgi:hypothetical protein